MSHPTDAQKNNNAVIAQSIKMTLLLGTLLTIINQWSEFMQDATVQWIPTVLTYLVVFFSIYVYQVRRAKQQDEELAENIASTVSPQHINALYKQAMIVERNAHKANAAFTHQIKTIHQLIERTQQIDNSADFEKSHTELVSELQQLETRISKIVKEMEKNVKLGEKLQQSVANIDPEIGVL